MRTLESTKLHQVRYQFMLPRAAAFNCFAAPEFYGSPMSRLQHKAWIALEQPSSSTLATCISVAIMSLIFASTVSFVLETDPNLRTQEHAAGFAIIETISVIAFTIEYFLRLLVCPDKATFLKSKLNGVDLCAILPFYIEKMMASSSLKGSQVLRVIRLVRVFRLMKISRYLTWLRVFGNTLRLSVAPLGMILFITLIATVVFSSAIFVSERGVTAGEGSSSLIPFDSIPTSFWWCVVTMTTVGYGDMVPQTLWGKLVAVVTAFSGILVSIHRACGFCSAHKHQAFADSCNSYFRDCSELSHRIPAFSHDQAAKLKAFSK